MASYFEDIILNYDIESSLSKIVFKITKYIKHDNDYDNAIKVILENNLKLEDIVNTTMRLTRKQLVDLASKMISNRN